MRVHCDQVEFMCIRCKFVCWRQVTTGVCVFVLLKQRHRHTYTSYALVHNFIKIQTNKLSRNKKTTKKTQSDFRFLGMCWIFPANFLILIFHFFCFVSFWGQKNDGNMTTFYPDYLHTSMIVGEVLHHPKCTSTTIQRRRFLRQSLQIVRTIGIW